MYIMFNKENNMHKSTIQFRDWVYADQFVQDIKDAGVKNVNFDSLMASVLIDGRNHAPTVSTTCDWLKSGYLGDLLAYTSKLDFLKNKHYGDGRYQDQSTLIPHGRMPAEQFDNILGDQLAINRI